MSDITLLKGSLLRRYYGIQHKKLFYFIYYFIFSSQQKNGVIHNNILLANKIFLTIKSILI